MNAAEFLGLLRNRGVKVWLEGAQLHYDAPSGVMDPELRAMLIAQKAQIVAFINQARSPALTAGPQIKRVPRDGDLPLSFAQERLWFINQLWPNSSAYNIAGGMWIGDVLRVEVLEQTINEVIRRHEVLRTTFDLKAGRPFQVIHPHEWKPLPIVDIGALAEEERAKEVQFLIDEESSRPFDLGKGPVARARLLRLGPSSHLIQFTLHHIASDRWSMAVLSREVRALYEAFSAGKPTPLPELEFQYADYAVWQRQWLQGEVLNRQLNYWKKQLGNEPVVLELPTDHARPSKQSFLGASESLRLDPAVARKLRAFGQREGGTLFMTLLAVFKALLYRYTGLKQIVVGTTVANRNRAEIEKLIGFFVNPLALRSDFSGNPTFKELLHQVRQVTLGAYDHQDLPFEKLVEELQPQRDLTRSPLFQVLMELQDQTEFPELNGKAETPASFQRRVQFDFRLVWIETGDDLAADLEYNADLFEQATIVRLAAHLKILVEALLKEPGRRLSELPIVTGQERELMLQQWRGSHRNHEADPCVQQMFEAQVERSPDAVAVAFEDQQLTFRELNNRANELAGQLIRSGVVPEVLVGLCVERSPEMVIGILGVLKAGGAYVPIDPDLPLERLSWMLQDSAMPLLLTQAHLEERLPRHESLTIHIDRAQALQPAGTENPRTSVCGENPAYVIYTSGSTGRPKGVVIRHHGLSNYLNWCSLAYKVAEGNGTLVHSSLGFDLTITGLLAPLIAGQKIILVPERNGVEALVAAFNGSDDLTLVKITPAHLELLRQATALPAGRTRAFIIGGEALTPENLLFWQTQAPATRLINEYGPTETVVGCCIYEANNRQRSLGTVPIGRPIANTSLYVLNEALELTPLKVPGHLYIGGAGVARGYLNRPDLTADCFMPDPYGNQGGARMYKSGDLVRCLADGNLQFVGRADQQIKLRGYRIEPGEIEAVLRAHDAIAEAAVLVREDNPGDRRLVAYVVPRENPVPTEELLASIKQKLPAYMIPAAIVHLEKLPLTINGKVDRRALPAPEGGRSGVGYEAPKDPVEKLMAGVWSKVLRKDEIGMQDNFFSLGGHSLLATELIFRIQKAFGVQLPLMSLYEAPTIAGLIDLLKTGSPQQLSSQAWSPLVPIRTSGSRQPLFLVHLMDGDVAAYAPLAKYLGSDQPVYGLQAAGQFRDPDIYGQSFGMFFEDESIEKMAARYVEALTGIDPGGPYFLGGASAGGMIAFEMARQLMRQGRKVAFLALLDSVNYKDLAPRTLDDGSYLLYMATHRPDMPGEKLKLSITDLQQHPIDERLKRVVDHMVETGFLPAPVELSAVQEWLKKDREWDSQTTSILRNYEPRVYEGQITLFRAEHLSLSTRRNLVEWEEKGKDQDYISTNGWSQLSTQPIRIQIVPGDHETMHREPHVQVVAAHLETCLQNAQKNG